LGRLLIVLLVVYPGYRLLLGPFWALDGRFGIVPDRVRAVVWSPVLWLRDIPAAYNLIDAYLDCWHVDSDGPATTR